MRTEKNVKESNPWSSAKSVWIESSKQTNSFIRTPQTDSWMTNLATVAAYGAKTGLLKL